MAQSNVFSLNTVGYYTLNLTNGFNMFANQMDADGSGTNNNVVTVFGTNNLPSPCTVYAWAKGASSFVSAGYNNGNFIPATRTNALNAAMQPGGGFFINWSQGANPPRPITFVGNVMQGTGLTNSWPSGFSIVSSMVPLAGTPTNTIAAGGLGYVPAGLDKIQIWNQALNAGAGGYATFAFGPTGTLLGGTPVPAIKVGTSFFISSRNGGGWGQNFQVQ